MKSDDIFCRIVAGVIPSVKIWEDDEFLAILDVFPNTEGQTLVIPKDHYDSDPTDMPDDKYCDLFLAAKEVAKLLKERLDVKRVAMVVEGIGVNHMHVKLYPLYGTGEGHLTTELGPQKSTEELESVSEKIRTSLSS